ncbi:MAG: serine hydrolase [Pseudomonadales bacterium]
MRSIDTRASGLAVLLIWGVGFAAIAAAGELMRGSPPPPEQQVTAGNWLEAPYHRWAFQHLESLLPTVTVDRSEGPASPLPAGAAEPSTFAFTDFSGRRRDLEQFLTDQHVDALLVWHDGAVIAEHYRNGQTPRTRHIMFSVTKSFTGLLAEMLIEDGVLDANRPVTHYVPELAGSAYGDATVRHVLDMEVGIDFTEIYDDPESEIARFAFAAGMRPAPAGFSGPLNLYAYLPTLKKHGEHGQDFHYVTANSEVLGWVLERAAGAPFGTLFATRLFQPVGPERDAFFLADPHGKAVSGGGLAITARDALRLTAMLAAGGRSGGRQVVPKPVIDRIAAGGTPRPSLWGNEDGGTDNSYRSQWYIHHPSGTYSAAGIHGQNLYVDPASGLAVVIQSSYPEADGAFFAVNDAFFLALADRLRAVQ